MRALAPSAINPSDVPEALRKLAAVWQVAAGDPLYGQNCIDVSIALAQCAIDIERRLDARLGQGQ